MITENKLIVEDGQPLDRVRQWVSDLPHEVLAAALVDVIARLGYDEDEVYQEDEQVSGADFISSVQHTCNHMLRIQLP